MPHKQNARLTITELKMTTSDTPQCTLCRAEELKAKNTFDAATSRKKATMDVYDAASRTADAATASVNGVTEACLRDNEAAKVADAEVDSATVNLAVASAAAVAATAAAAPTATVLATATATATGLEAAAGTALAAAAAAGAAAIAFVGLNPALDAAAVAAAVAAAAAQDAATVAWGVVAAAAAVAAGPGAAVVAATAAAGAAGAALASKQRAAAGALAIAQGTAAKLPGLKAIESTTAATKALAYTKDQEADAALSAASTAYNAAKVNTAAACG